MKQEDILFWGKSGTSLCYQSQEKPVDCDLLMSGYRPTDRDVIAFDSGDGFGTWVDGKSQDEINLEARQYLKDTDWYVTRRSETNQAIPADVLALRAEARAKVV